MKIFPHRTTSVYVAATDRYNNTRSVDTYHFLQLLLSAYVISRKEGYILFFSSSSSDKQYESSSTGFK